MVKKPSWRRRFGGTGAWQPGTTREHDAFAFSFACSFSSLETVLFECTVLFYLDKERDPGMAPGNRGSVPPGIFKPVPSPHESFSGKESSYRPSRPKGCLRSKANTPGNHFIVA